jgi:hypothetical protein
MLLNSECSHECYHNIHEALLALTSFMNSNWSVILYDDSSGKITWHCQSQFESLERFIDNAHGFELDALVRIGALCYLMSAESNGVIRVNSCFNIQKMENKNGVPFSDEHCVGKGWLPYSNKRCVGKGWLPHIPTNVASVNDVSEFNVPTKQ